MRVLVVEDERHALEAMVFFLEANGHHVLSATSSSTAGDILERERVDALICDWRLDDGVTGVNVARVGQREQKNLPVVFITAQSLPELREAASDITCARFLAKPVSLQVLQETLASVVTTEEPALTSGRKE